MKLLKKMMQVALATFFFGLLGTSTVFADDSEGWQFVQENGRTYYKKGDLKETYWRVIDGKYYYFDPLSGEMVVGWQYIPAPHKGVTIGPSPRIEISLRPDWFYFWSRWCITRICWQASFRSKNCYEYQQTSWGRI
ncbi:choline-binding protein F%2C point mutation [Streptococcus pneumoniae]|nr:choline-binding protein F%2C point mutation [Streptococcus pneumoniae]CJQ52403.1 choline-binding protein F%2C point mutation [Streptococcus pneumoniae]CJY10287.1 choline-binding protein F%2C point mutation [Streptococcus pneumoniae]